MITNNLYVKLKSGLGNMLFQIAAGLFFAIKHNKQLIINENLIQPSHHRLDKTKLVNILKNLYPQLIFSTDYLYTDKDKQLSNLKDILISYPDAKILSNLYEYKELKHKCFTNLEESISLSFKHYDNIILAGYFINYNYIKDNQLFNKINIEPETKNLLNINFKNLYFIHIRLGDYIDNNLHVLDLSNYYIYCINKIKSINPVARFYICTNSYDSNLTKYLDNFPIKDYILQDEKNNDIDTLYIMSSCIGGICSNSTLSYLGSYFQKNKKKNNIYMPYPFVNFINGYTDDNITKDIYPEWCTIYNIFNNQIDNFDNVKNKVIYKKPNIMYIASNNDILGIKEKYKKLSNIIQSKNTLQTNNIPTNTLNTTKSKLKYLDNIVQPKIPYHDNISQNTNLITKPKLKYLDNISQNANLITKPKLKYLDNISQNTNLITKPKLKYLDNIMQPKIPMTLALQSDKTQIKKPKLTYIDTNLKTDITQTDKINYKKVDMSYINNILANKDKYNKQNKNNDINNGINDNGINDNGINDNGINDKKPKISYLNNNISNDTINKKPKILYLNNDNQFTKLSNSSKIMKYKKIGLKPIIDVKEGIQYAKINMPVKDNNEINMLPKNTNINIPVISTKEPKNQRQVKRVTRIENKIKSE